MRKKGAIFLALVYGVMIVLFYAPNPSFSIFNKDWDGCSNLTRLISERGGKIELLRSLEGFNTTEGFKGKVLVILSPVSEFDESECERIVEFIRKGGSLIIADDFRKGDSISKYFGVSFSKKLLLEPSSYSKQPSFPVVNITLEDRKCSMLLNYPSTLVLTGKLSKDKYLIKVSEQEFECKLIILARSSQMSWLDSDYDFNRDEGEPRSSFPLMVLIEFGEGRVVVVSDPDLFINDMIYRFDNLEITNFILDYVSGTNSSPTFYFMEERVWRIKPLFFYALMITNRWGEMPFFSRILISSVAMGSIFLAFLYGFTSVMGYPFLESILGILGATEEGKESEGPLERVKQETEIDYGQYLLPLFERVFGKLREELSLKSISMGTSGVVEAVVARYPTLDAKVLRELIARYDDLRAGGRISNFRTFSRVFDALMSLARELGVEW